ncbi:hypothetical protein [Roseibium sp. RKSG952]|uniref:hypothetical protein n=1 Tax=Roseibium sp. RKSG952 TaxID=2529384 RepID=UPI0012BB7063|nr:hypothetical protein [Roseibium sp. RKSG952]MTH98234.1 hypothetical protein [Roseibium sp. RKSG952]
MSNLIFRVVGFVFVLFLNMFPYSSELSAADKTNKLEKEIIREFEDGIFEYYSNRVDVKLNKCILKITLDVHKCKTGREIKYRIYNINLIDVAQVKLLGYHDYRIGYDQITFTPVIPISSEQGPLHEYFFTDKDETSRSVIIQCNGKAYYSKEEWGEIVLIKRDRAQVILDLIRKYNAMNCSL